MIITKTVSDPWFSLIATGSKTIEGRLNKGDFKLLRIHDYIKFENNDLGFLRFVIVKITNRIHYRSFKKYLTSEQLTNTLPTVNNIKDGVDIYRKFYSKHNEREYGVLAIHFTISNN